MSFIVDKRREDDHTREDYGSVWNLSWIFFSRVYLRSTCSKTFQLMVLNASLLNSWNEMKIEKLHVFFGSATL